MDTTYSAHRLVLKFRPRRKVLLRPKWRIVREIAQFQFTRQAVSRPPAVSNYFCCEIPYSEICHIFNITLLRIDLICALRIVDLRKNCAIKYQTVAIRSRITNSRVHRAYGLP